MKIGSTDITTIKAGITPINRVMQNGIIYFIATPGDLAVTIISGGVRLTWTSTPGTETEVYLSIDSGTYTLITTLGLTIGTYDYITDDGVNLSFKVRSKYDTSVLDIPINLFALKITGGVMLTWNDNNAEAEYIEIYTNIDSAGYTLLTTINAGVETYNHTITYTTIEYKVRAKEGTLPIYSSYSDISVPVIITGVVTDVNKDKVVLTFSESLNESSIPANTDFALTGKTITNVAINGTTLTLTVSVAYIGGDVISVIYTRPISNPITCNTSGIVSSFTKSIINFVAPTTLTDTNQTAGWFVADDISTLTKDTGVTEEVTQWNDKSGSSHHLLDPGATKRPIWSSGGILFDGANDFMKCNAFTYNQPEMIYIVVKQLTWQANDQFFDGNTGGKGCIQDSPTSPGIKANAGTASSVNNNLALDTWGIVRVLFNGASSSLQVNETTIVTGDFGANNLGGFTLAAYGGGVGTWANIQVKEIILRKIADDSTSQTAIYNYLKSKYSL